MKVLKKLFRSAKKNKKNIKTLADNSKALTRISIENYINKNLYEHPRYQDSKRLNKFEYQCYSQNGEDGIIAEIFKRIGTTNKFFAEFGASTNGLENNTSYLLLKDWKGYWIEGSSKNVEQIKKKYSTFVNGRKLFVKAAFVTAENIEELFKEAKVPEELDFLSIDIDGNDYWVWNAITNYRPRVVVIEYNPVFSPDIKWVMKYDPKRIWNGTTYYGVSLKSLEILGIKKGYKLVGCNFTGANAFFVREDLVKDKFLEPFTSENHYEPPRYFLLRNTSHERDFGDFEAR